MTDRTDRPTVRARLGLGRTLHDLLELPAIRPTDRLGTDRSDRTHSTFQEDSAALEIDIIQL